MNEFYLPNIGYNNRRDTQNLCLAYTKDTLIILNISRSTEPRSEALSRPSLAGDAT